MVTDLGPLELSKYMICSEEFSTLACGSVVVIQVAGPFRNVAVYISERLQLPDLNLNLSDSMYAQYCDPTGVVDRVATSSGDVGGGGGEVCVMQAHHAADDSSAGV